MDQGLQKALSALCLKFAERIGNAFNTAAVLRRAIAPALCFFACFFSPLEAMCEVSGGGRGKRERGGEGRNRGV